LEGGEMKDTSIRHFGDETPFSSWLRQKNREMVIPSISPDLGVVFNDIDMVVSCYHKNQTGRFVYSMFIVEVKTRGGTLTTSQRYLYPALSCFAKELKYSDKIIRFYGCMQLIMSGTSPEDSEWMEWKRFPFHVKSKREEVPKIEDMRSDRVDLDGLVKILRFDTHPISLKKFRPEMKKHGMNEVVRTVTTPLGFTVNEVVKKTY
jgi:hypothetical protein